MKKTDINAEKTSWKKHGNIVFVKECDVLRVQNCYILKVILLVDRVWILTSLGLNKKSCGSRGFGEDDKIEISCNMKSNPACCMLIWRRHGGYCCVWIKVAIWQGVGKLSCSRSFHVLYFIISAYKMTNTIFIEIVSKIF